MNIPVGVLIAQNSDPFGQSRLAGINLLSATYEADDDAPIRVTIHCAEQKRRLRHVESCMPALLLHEFACHLAIPRALRLVKDHYLLDGWAVTIEGLIAKMVDVLHEGGHLPIRLSAWKAFALCLIPSQGLPKDIYQRSVTR